MQEMQETQGQTLGQKDSLVEEMATHSSIIAWTEEPGRLRSMQLQSQTQGSPQMNRNIFK